MIMKLL